MKLTVIGSSSRGNAYALQSETQTLFIEAGVKLASVKKVLNYELKDVVGCCVTHVHGDHSRYTHEYKTLGNIPVISPMDNSLEGKTYSLGEFQVTPFSVYHDVPCFGYIIYHPEMGSLLFATDTYALPYEFHNVNHWLIEANYSDAILNDNVSKGEVDNFQRKRIVTSHMSLDYCIKAIREGGYDKTNNIVLIHLSSRNSNAEDFRTRVAANFGVPTYIAHKGLTLELKKHGTI